MEIKLFLEEAKKLTKEDFQKVISQLQNYTVQTKNDGWLVVMNEGDNDMIVNTYIDVDVSKDRFVESLHTYYYKNYIDKHKLKLEYR